MSLISFNFKGNTSVLPLSRRVKMLCGCVGQKWPRWSLWAESRLQRRWKSRESCQLLLLILHVLCGLLMLPSFNYLRVSKVKLAQWLSLFKLGDALNFGSAFNNCKFMSQHCISAPPLHRPGDHLELFSLSAFLDNEQTLRRPMLHRLRHPPHFSTFPLGTVPSLLVLHSHRCFSNIMSSALTFSQLSL